MEYTRTFIFDEKTIKKALKILKGADFESFSDIYYHEKSALYIWETVGYTNPIIARIADMGKEITLQNRREYLHLFCKKLDKNNLS